MTRKQKLKNIRKEKNDKKRQIISFALPLIREAFIIVFNLFSDN